MGEEAPASSHGNPAVEIKVLAVSVDYLEKGFEKLEKASEKRFDELSLGQDKLFETMQSQLNATLGPYRAEVEQLKIVIGKVDREHVQLKTRVDTLESTAEDIDDLKRSHWMMKGAFWLGTVLGPIVACLITWYLTVKYAPSIQVSNQPQVTARGDHGQSN